MKIFTTQNHIEGEQYDVVTCLRVMKGEEFVKKVEDGGHEITAIEFEDNNMCFYLRKKICEKCEGTGHYTTGDADTEGEKEVECDCHPNPGSSDDE